MHTRLAALRTQQSRVTKAPTNPRNPPTKTNHPELTANVQSTPSNTLTKPPSPSHTHRPSPPPSLLAPPLTRHAFELGARLGRGKFGRVYLARHKPTNYICALKVLSKASCMASREESLIRRELEVHSNLAHAHILRLLAWFHDGSAVYLVLEYAPGGSLFGALEAQRWGRFGEAQAARYVAQVGSALAYLRAKRVLHRDVKPENILLGFQGEVKLADFGYSVHSSSGARHTICGTLDYLSPEVARMLLSRVQGQSGDDDDDDDGEAEHHRYTAAVDQWSLGILAYELLVGKPPFERESVEETRACIAAFDGDIEFPAYVSAGARDLVTRLLDVRAERRLGFEQVMLHPWIVEHAREALVERGGGEERCG